jgi:hypothetical protein
VSKLQDEVFIFSIMSGAGSFAFTIVRMSAFVSDREPAWLKAEDTYESVITRRKRIVRAARECADETSAIPVVGMVGELPFDEWPCTPLAGLHLSVGRGVE